MWVDLSAIDQQAVIDAARHLKSVARERSPTGRFKSGRLTLALRRHIARQLDAVVVKIQEEDMRRLYPYRGPRGYSVTSPARPFVRTGEFRAPRRGEFYLSGAIPEVYIAPNDLAPVEYDIMRPATAAEAICPTCQRALPME